jgi:UDP-glucose:(heptosyl)LPS alpha-1,3-glucosyltransferase
MNVALVIETMDAAKGGREAATGQIATRLAEAGCGVTILAETAAGELPGVTLRALGRKGRGARRLEHFLSAVQSALDGVTFDIVHAMLPVPGCDLYQPRGGSVSAQDESSAFRRGPLLGLAARWIRNLNAKRRLLRDLECRVVASSAWIVPNSEMVAEEYFRYFGRSERVRTIYNAVDLPPYTEDQRAAWREKIRHKLGISDDQPVFLSVAKNFELKAMDRLILNFAAWCARHPNPTGPQLILIGREHWEGYQRIAGLNQIGRQVHFVPPTREMLPWYAAADAVVLLSWYDACSRVILEAVRLGLPAMTTRQNGAAEVLAAGAGVVVDSPRDKRGIRAGLDTLCDPDARHAMQQAARDKQSYLSMQRHVEELLTLYQEIRST